MLVWTYVGELSTWAAFGWRGYYEVKIGGRVQLVQPDSSPVTVIDLGSCTADSVDECKERCEAHHRDVLLSATHESAPSLETLVWTRSPSGTVYQAIGCGGLYELTVGGRVRYGWRTGQQMDFFDLGACNESNLEFCRRVCHEHNRMLMADGKKTGNQQRGTGRGGGPS